MMKTLFAWMLLLSVCTGAFSARAQDGAGATDEENEERHFDTLAVGALSFTNVWVHRQTNAVILIRHSRGIHSIKLSDLPAEELIELKAQVGDLAELPSATPSGWRNSPFIQKILGLLNGSSSRTKVIMGIVGALIVVLIAVKMFAQKKTTAT